MEANFQARVPSSKMDRIVAWGVALCVLTAAILSCYYGANAATPEVIVVEATPAPVSANVAMPASQDYSGEAFVEEFNLVPLAWIVGIGLAAFVFYKVIVETGFWKVLMGIGAAALVVGTLFWVLLYRGGDVSTADARDENLQVVKVVQPVGDPQVDETYAGINRENAGTNIVNAGGVAIYMVLFFVGLIVVGGIMVVGHYYFNR